MENIIPIFQTKYHLSQISQNSDGLILRGLGSISLQRATYSPDNTTASIIIDNASVVSRLENKTYKIPSSNPDYRATLTINKINSRKIKLTLNGEALRDYRFIISPDGQSLYISHRTFILNTIFSSNTATVSSYKLYSTQAGYKVFELTFDKPVTYDVFELNNNFYLNINNLGDYSETLLDEILKTSDMKIEALKISSDKTRFIIPSENINFSYANVESNAKSIKLCFKEKPKNPPQEEKEVIISYENKKENTSSTKEEKENINVIYVPKADEIKKEKEKEIEKPKKKKEDMCSFVPHPSFRRKARQAHPL